MKKIYPNSLPFRKKIMRHYALLPLLLFINVFKPIDKCPCEDTQGTNHTRFEVKTRLPEAADGDKITFSKLNKLKITNQQIQKLKTDGTQILPTEQNPVHFTGYLCLLKISPDDCDMHFEISFKKDITAFRVIAEVPNTAPYCALREEIFKTLKTKYNLKKHNKYLFGTGSIKVIPKITVHGFPFFDNAHVTLPNHGTKLVQTLWEIHPVYKIDWVN